MTTLFISDLHLDLARPAILDQFESFIREEAVHADALYILGDLFEAWIGDDADDPVGKRFVAAMKPMREARRPCFFMHGNRDFLLGERFAREAGMTLLPDPSVIDLYGTPTLLMHGDSLCTLDSDYQQFRRTARDPAWQSQLLAQPLAQRRALATRLRAMSREAGSMKSEDIMDVTPAEVDRAMAAHGARQLIHGHTHRPARHESPAGLRWVLGAWEQCGWAIEAKIDEIDLMNFNIYQ